MSAPFRGKSFQMVIVQQTAAEWADTSDRVLQDYELGQETDTGLAKMGDGVTTWADLDYWSPSSNAKRYVALLTQTGTDAPVATVLENTLGGEVVWTYNGPGDYTGTLAGAFPANKTGAAYGVCPTPADGTLWQCSRGSDNTLSLLAGYLGDAAELQATIFLDLLVYP